MHKYFISFTGTSSTDNQLYGHDVVNCAFMVSPVVADDFLKGMVKFLEEKNNLHNVIILNYQYVGEVPDDIHNKG